MQSLAELQRSFATALLDPALPAPAGLVGPDGKPSSRRFAVYRNNVILGLTQTLKDSYPVVHRIVGSEFFLALARAYVVGDLPRSPMLFDYGAGLPNFIGRFEPASVLPYLADVARIERAWTEAYHAAEASPISVSEFAEIAPDRLPAITLVLHPSVRIVRSRFPALSIWQMNVDGGVPGPVDLTAGGENALVIRPEAGVEVRSIPNGSPEFIHALGSGRPVLAALKEAIAADPVFDLSANLSDLIQAGAVVSYGFAQELLRS
ncbi:DNA-binding domain-containing protein [Roseiarcaceae bacterium H3SJ34-1]|uniref:HvfC/BufC N-terminal domain-containing protein n=1 Tax=Terripilifer ovatus TaxID=3032367 RepID=UPI003AB98140|nr:DNA-binding domain-containing protein [Roseiarcaceae bacterium H3SJ34-1]